MLRPSLLQSRFVFSPLLHFKQRRNFVSFAKSPVAVSCSRRCGDRNQLRAFKMSAGGSDTNPDTDVAVPPPLVHKSKIRYCQACGNPTKHIVPDGEEKLRAVCTACERIHYENPKMVVGCLVEHDNKVLLCKRNIEPSFGLWTLPAGFLEIGESALEGAARETLEEACAKVDIISPFAQLDIPLIGQSYIIFRARLKSPEFSPGPESLECALFALDDIPFHSLAFSSIIVTLKMVSLSLSLSKAEFHMYPCKISLFHIIPLNREISPIPLQNHLYIMGTPIKSLIYPEPEHPYKILKISPMPFSWMVSQNPLVR